MDGTNTLGTKLASRPAALHSLAAVGFVTLVSLGVWLAVYSTRFVPQAVGSIGSAAVYLGSVFKPAPHASISVVPAASTTIPFDVATTTAPVAATAATTTDERAKAPASAPSAGKETASASPLGVASPAVLSGLPDLVTHIDAVGYLATSSADSFVASSTVPAGSRPAVRFTIKNIGSNATGSWRWSASIPTSSDSIYQSAAQQSLNPGDYIEYTLGFDQANPGTSQMISVTANFDHAVTESATNNDSASVQIKILGS